MLVTDVCSEATAVQCRILSDQRGGQSESLILWHGPFLFPPYSFPHHETCALM